MNVCETELSPLNAAALPTMADAAPPCAVALVVAEPTTVHPLRPDSNPLFTSPLGGGGGGAFTVSEAVAEWEPDVAVPVIVSVEVPAGVEVAVATVMVEPEPAVTDAGLKLAVVPAGKPLADSVIVCAAPLVTAVVTL